MLGNDLLSRRVTPAVPSALEGLTTVFGKGTGVSPPPLSPNAGIIPRPQGSLLPHTQPGLLPSREKDSRLGFLSRAAAPGSKALDLARLGRRDVVRTASPLAHTTLLLDL